MGSAHSSSLPMNTIDFETYKGLRYSQELPNTRESNRGPIFVTKSTYIDPRKLNLWDNLLVGHGLEHGNRPCYGTREIINGKPGGYTWITYNQVVARAEAIASGLTQFAHLERQQCVGIFSKNRLEWMLGSHACDRQAYTLVPLYDTLGPDAVPYIVNHTALTTMLCGHEQFQVVLESKQTCPTLKYIIQYEHVSEEQRRIASEHDLEIRSLEEIETYGSTHPLPADPPLEEDVATICYTSGTTGNPKGVVLLHKSMVLVAAAAGDRLQLSLNTVHISYLPLPHVFERAVMALLNQRGGAAGFYRGDTLTLLEDVTALQPTIFVSVPRLFNRVYDKITQGVEAAGGLKKLLFDQAYASKKAGIVTGHKTHALWDALVFSKIRMLLGGRVEIMVSGSAPLSAEVKEFCRIVFSCDVVEGYGLSETGAGLTLASTDMPIGPHVGIPISNIQVRLEDVPEMGYTSNDKPRPRGEVLCRGEMVFAGYYKEPEKTAEAIDSTGWFHTGDIGCWNADGTLSIIDRKKNIFKLSQGEYVAAEKIEGVYMKSKYIAQIFVYGDSFQSTLVGIVVPDPEVAEAWGLNKGYSKTDATTSKIVKDPEFLKSVLADMERVGKEAQLRGFEYVRSIHLYPDPFTVDIGLITPTFKLKRPQLKAFFQKEIDAMYSK